ncbi:MAG: hypothetical protein QNI96_03325 [Woeseiaceae bacterium]|nr:hypothetical protein [Woeseiaceae bacterium]
MNKASLPVLISLSLLTACGGSNSDNANNGNPPPGAAMPITSDNGLSVAQESYQQASSSGDLAGLAASNGLTGNAGGGLFKPDIERPGIIDTLMQVPIPQTTVPCAAGGTLTISGNLEDPITPTLTAGDTISAEYEGCDDGIGEVIDGAIDFEVVAFSGDAVSGLYDMTMTMLLDNLQVTSAEDVVLANGDATATLNTLQAPYVEAAVSGGSMLSSNNSGTATLSGYSSAQTFDGTVFPSPYTLLTSGVLDSSELSGSVTYSTPVMFEGVDTNYPTVGEMLLVGDASSARIIAQANGIDVVIEIYSNTTGEGTPDATINTTWTELAGL